MKFSTYISSIPLSDTLQVLYNALSDKYLFIRNSIDINKLSPAEIELRLPRLHTQMVAGGFIVPEEKDEYAEFIQRASIIEYGGKEIQLIVNPTLQCNFRCWYCYEEHEPTHMTSATMTGIRNLIQQLAQSGHDINLSFFGGEPMLCFDNVVLPLIQYGLGVCNDNRVKFRANATSNGYLLNESRIFSLKSNGFNFIQITLDGNEYDHNQTRKTASGQGSYRTIINNIISLSRAGIYVLIRLNYTSDNIIGMVEIPHEFSALTTSEKKFISVSLHRVWQGTEAKDKDVETVINAFAHIGITAKPVIYGEFCYGDLRTSLVINYNGDLYKCTAVDFLNTPRDGYITPNGDTIWENDSLEQRMKQKFSNPECKSCRIFPLCHGGCSSRPLKFPQGYCILEHDSDKKDSVILD